MNKKLCPVCKRYKDKNLFGKNKTNKDGLSYQCKLCKVKSNKIYKSNNKEKIKISNCLYRNKNKKEIANYKKKWADRNRKRVNEKSKMMRLKHLNKVKARSILNRYVLKKIIIKPSICEMCKESRKCEGHHLNYDKPLLVIWLCKECHLKIHLKDIQRRTNT